MLILCGCDALKPKSNDSGECAGELSEYEENYRELDQKINRTKEELKAFPTKRDLIPVGASLESEGLVAILRKRADGFTGSDTLVHFADQKVYKNKIWSDGITPYQECIGYLPPEETGGTEAQFQTLLERVKNTSRISPSYGCYEHVRGSIGTILYYQDKSYLSYSTSFNVNCAKEPIVGLSFFDKDVLGDLRSIIPGTGVTGWGR